MEGAKKSGQADSNVYTRFSKKEGKIAAAFLDSYSSESREAIGFAPVGLDEPYRVFISEDPIGLKGGINKFSYVGNNSVNYIDPLGLKFSWGVGGSLGIVDIEWDSADPMVTQMDWVSPQLGGGAHFNWTRSPKKQNPCPGGETPLDEVPIIYNVGFGRYLGFSFADDLSSFSLNIGLAIPDFPLSLTLPGGPIIQW
jgi:hypothetical protein